jgi:hypothetical protein
MVMDAVVVKLVFGCFDGCLFGFVSIFTKSEEGFAFL